MSDIKNLAALDLRNYSPAALKKIGKISNVALILLPENPSPEFSEAYAEIEKINVVSETNVPVSACFFNGAANLTGKDLAKNSFVVCNGLAILRDIPEELNIRLVVNGALVISETAFVNIEKINGAKYPLDNASKLIVSMPEITINKDFLQNLGEKTAIIGCGTVSITDDITNEELREKGIVFYNVGIIIAKKELHGYVQTNSYGTGAIREKDNKFLSIFKRK